MHQLYNFDERCYGLKSLDHSLMMQQKLKWRVNSNSFLQTSFHFQHVRIISDWIKFFDKITLIPHMSFRNHFLILILLHSTLRQCHKNCNIFQRGCRLVCLRTLIFTPKKCNELFLKILFLPTEFFLIKVLSLSPLFVYGKAERQRIQCEIAAEIIGISFPNITVASFR